MSRLDTIRGNLATCNDAGVTSRSLEDATWLLIHADALAAGLRKARRGHRIVDDCWYSCPKATDAEGQSEYCGEGPRDVCKCGADADNAAIDALLAAYEASP
jgi:hypothetical protein